MRSCDQGNQEKKLFPEKKKYTDVNEFRKKKRV
jgi:hypothetical protein